MGGPHCEPLKPVLSLKFIKRGDQTAGDPTKMLQEAYTTLEENFLLSGPSTPLVELMPTCWRY